MARKREAWHQSAGDSVVIKLLGGGTSPQESPPGLHAEVAEWIAAELGRTVEEVERAYMRSKAGTGISQRLDAGTRRDL